MAMQSDLRAATQNQGPPFSLVDKQGNRTGSSAEFCRLMAEEMGVEVKVLGTSHATGSRAIGFVKSLM